MFTHKPVRTGSVVSISIYGENGARFARRIAENAVRDGERLGANLDVITEGDRQNFVFSVERVTPAVAPLTPATAARRTLRPSHLFKLAPQRGPAFRSWLGLGHSQVS